MKVVVEIRTEVCLPYRRNCLFHGGLRSGVLGERTNAPFEVGPEVLDRVEVRALGRPLGSVPREDFDIFSRLNSTQILAV